MRAVVLATALHKIFVTAVCWCNLSDVMLTQPTLSYKKEMFATVFSSTNDLINEP